MSISKKYFLFCAVIVASANVWGQSARSPVSGFGIGEPYGASLAHNQGMGGTGVSQPQYWFANNQNPALLVFNSFTNISAGIYGEKRTISGDSVKEENYGGTINYLVMIFPVKLNRWTTSAGLMPYTNVNYGLTYTDSVKIDGTNQYVDSVTQYVTNSSLGGLSQVYWSNGVRLTPDMSIGLKAAYLFGYVDNTYSTILSNTGQSPNYLITTQEKTTVKGFNFSLGYSFSKDSLFRKKDYRVSFGAVYNFRTKLNGKKDSNLFRTIPPGVADTLDYQNISTAKGGVTVPSSITAGFSLSKGLKWSVSTEFSFQDWTTFKSVNKDFERGAGKQYRASLGGEFTPDALALESFLKRITYRVGGSIEQYPFLVNDKVLKDFGINFGFSLPAGRSSVDLGFKVGKRGDKATNLLVENYFKVYLGISLNDTWFVKRKFD